LGRGRERIPRKGKRGEGKGRKGEGREGRGRGAGRRRLPDCGHDKYRKNIAFIHK